MHEPNSAVVKPFEKRGDDLVLKTFRKNTNVMVDIASGRWPVLVLGASGRINSSFGLATKQRGEQFCKQLSQTQRIKRRNGRVSPSNLFKIPRHFFHHL
jgi:hypothetical protein